MPLFFWHLGCRDCEVWHTGMSASRVIVLINGCSVFALPSLHPRQLWHSAQQDRGRQIQSRRRRRVERLCVGADARLVVCHCADAARLERRRHVLGLPGVDVARVDCGRVAGARRHLTKTNIQIFFSKRILPLLKHSMQEMGLQYILSYPHAKI